jgi:hypothetical protein
MRKSASVAIWIGHFESESALDDYLFFEFPHDFGVTPDENNQPEFVVSAISKSIEDLLKDFSQSRTFLKDASNVAMTKGYAEANAALVFYYTFFDSEGNEARADTPIQFLGNFAMKQQDEEPA